uniref:Nuclear transcription factor Y subunit putative n=1 Tax=Albugo laibachii Nc14 TaxID=890382 RepID=F0WIH8_9STRA|nr:nuclear transcription factor Y subunit putative [Albugo laibachii Nc14]|eukprot:CCA21060.1 nuclear transcription factor Y subunit putative [Albugo laibachii Nc14]
MSGEDTSASSGVQMQLQLEAQRAQMQQQQLQLNAFWQSQIHEISQINPYTFDFKTHQLPLARIKKIMKADEDVRMISAEAPVLFAKACEMFIQELSMRSWTHTEENKRRTLQRSDIAAALAKSDMFDFLIDIVPRDEFSKGASKKAPADSQAVFQQQLQQQQAFMLQQLIQQQIQTGNTSQMPWTNPQLQQQMLQQLQQQMQTMQSTTAINPDDTGDTSQLTSDDATTTSTGNLAQSVDV